ncbi:Ubiquitin-like domain-containing CTD phosphatase 1 [Anabarilius grahami]|uniref:Ubiquitin-like domain-containing CTD phosphatase 1 n=1 Tax=Anabarilius grahami TaxID=495550 RepID=A0A3N0XUX4_ANAGA|nr:Ubiquitin-like domain-containing CTD phosphatase 1 [Anabarilius grahami]
MSVSVIIKWGGQEYSISTLSEEDTVLDLKQSIKSLTGVLPERQKLLGLKLKGKPADDDVKLGDLKLKPNTKIMMMGTREEKTGQELMRPYLHEFLTSAYEDYDIVIWSATSMKWIDAKMKELGVTDNPNYKITFMLDSAAMITVHTPKRGVVEVKPLGVIWGKYSEFYDRKNTIMFDDIGRNFLMNPQNGLKIRPFMKAHLNREKDKELYKLSLYLKEIAKLEDFSGLNHKHWER